MKSKAWIFYFLFLENKRLGFNKIDLQLELRYTFNFEAMTLVYVFNLGWPDFLSLILKGLKLLSCIDKKALNLDFISTNGDGHSIVWYLVRGILQYSGLTTRPRTLLKRWEQPNSLVPHRR